MIFEKSTENHAAIERDIHNANPFFNRISNGREELTEDEVRTAILDADKAGAERFLIRHEGRYVGVIEYLMHNPNDGRTWLGLLLIHGGEHARGLGKSALEHFYGIMRERGVVSFRIGVLVDNEPAHRFWKKQGFVPLDGTAAVDGKQAVVYEKEIT